MQIFSTGSQKFRCAHQLRPLPSTKRSLESNGIARAVRSANESYEEEAVLYLGIERIGELGVVECKGRIVRSEAAYTRRVRAMVHTV